MTIRSTLWRLVMGVSVLVGMLPPAAHAATDTAAASSIPVSDFFRRPSISSPKLSPSGKLVAMLAPSTAKDSRVTLAVASVDTPQKLKVVAFFDDADVRDFHWVNDQRLVFGVVDFRSALGEQHDSGLYGVNVDGTEFVWLIARRSDDQDEQNFARRPLRWNHEFLMPVNDGSDDVFIQRYELRRRSSEPVTTTPLRMNTKTRSLQGFKMPSMPEGARRWVLDRSEPRQPRAVMSIVGDLTRVLWRNDSGGDWVELARFHTFAGGDGAFTPEAFGPDGQLYVEATQDNAERTTALYRYDVEKRKIGVEPLITFKGFDFSGNLVFDRSQAKPLGVRFLTDARGTEWLTPAMKALQDRVDKLLPGTINLIDCRRCSSDQKLLITAFSDRQSAIYFLYDRESDKLQLIAASRAWLDAAQMAEVDFERVPARDGLSVPVYVTRPKGKGPWPAVVLVHGGPYVRGSEWDWSPQPQFLASRGYLVIEPEFRGSRGFGDRYFQAGWRQWGLAMQDDITDATRWAIQKGLADPKRIAIAGASYGGYATMMGLVREPDLYRAGINWVGVTDIGLMYDIGWSDFAGGDWQRYGMPRLVGDPEADKAQLVATSPLKQAARITKPVLMAYGGRDFRVPLPHGADMRSALKKAGKVEVEWIEYELEGHGWMLTENQVDFWTRVERFLAKNLQ